MKIGTIRTLLTLDDKEFNGEIREMLNDEVLDFSNSMSVREYGATFRKADIENSAKILFFMENGKTANVVLRHICLEKVLEISKILPKVKKERIIRSAKPKDRRKLNMLLYNLKIHRQNLLSTVVNHLKCRLYLPAKCRPERKDESF